MTSNGSIVFIYYFDIFQLEWNVSYDRIFRGKLGQFRPRHRLAFINLAK